MCDESIHNDRHAHCANTHVMNPYTTTDTAIDMRRHLHQYTYDESIHTNRYNDRHAKTYSMSFFNTSAHTCKSHVNTGVHLSIHVDTPADPYTH